MSCMNSMNFLKGVGLGLVIGAAAGMAATPKKKGGNVIGKTLKTMGDAISDVVDTMGL